LLDRNVDLCNLTIADDEELDDYEKQIDHDGFALMLRYQPVATDLREVLSAMKISSNLERIGDMSVTIARRARKLAKHKELVELASLAPVLDYASLMLKDAMAAYSNTDVAAAEEILQRDDELDRMCKRCDNEMTASMATAGEKLPGYVNLLFVSRSLERVGDRACNIAEDTIFIANNEDVRHQH